MAWKGLHVSRPCRLRIQSGNVRLQDEGDEIVVPLEDLAYLVLDAPHAETTVPFLSACADSGCLLITTDSRHMPNGLLLPFNAHHRQAEVLHLQIAMSEPRKKRLWQAVITQKILNQAECLRRSGVESRLPVFTKLARSVKSGDPENIEGIAARQYWPLLFDGFRRNTDGEDRLNGMLNYGYAIMRGFVARQIACTGFTPALGIHHRSLQNPFNLADDLIEPLRPAVDRLVTARFAGVPDGRELSKDDRTYLLTMPQTKFKLGDEVFELLTCVKLYIESIRRYMESGNIKEVLIPEFAPQEE